MRQPGLGKAFPASQAAPAGPVGVPLAPDKESRPKNAIKTLKIRRSLEPQPTKLGQDLCAEPRQGDGPDRKSARVEKSLTALLPTGLNWHF